jgi:hypothetical protein
LQTWQTNVPVFQACSPECAAIASSIAPRDNLRCLDGETSPAASFARDPRHLAAAILAPAALLRAAGIPGGARRCIASVPSPTRDLRALPLRERLRVVLLAPSRESEAWSVRRDGIRHGAAASHRGVPVAGAGAVIYARGAP